MRALVTGATGFVGRALVARLAADEGTEVTAWVRGSGSDVPREFDPRVRVVRGELNDARLVRRAATGVDVIFHLAARLRAAAADIVRDTAVTTSRFFDTLVSLRSPPKVLLLSSFGVYRTSDDTGEAPLDEVFPLETRPAERDPYSYAKWLQERVARDLAASAGLPLVVVRAGTIWGRSASPLTARVGFVMGRGLLHLGGDNLVPLCHVGSVAEAMRVVADRSPVGRTWNVVDDSPPTARALAELASARLGLHVLSIPRPITYLGARAMAGYANRTHGQLPALLTEYRARSLYTSHRYSNAAIRTLGWTPSTPSSDELAASIGP